MKKFSTFNGLFTRCPNIIPQNYDYIPQNTLQDNIAEKIEEESNNSSENNITDTEILHYPQNDNIIPFYNQNNQNNTEQLAETDKIDKNEVEDINQSQNYSQFKLSHNAKTILECMRLHDRIINDYNNSKK